MNTFMITAGVFLLAFAAMAVGVLFSNRRIRGSCGGLAGLQDEQGRPMCDACSAPESCDRFTAEHQEPAAAAK